MSDNKAQKSTINANNNGKLSTVSPQPNSSGEKRSSAMLATSINVSSSGNKDNQNNINPTTQAKSSIKAKYLPPKNTYTSDFRKKPSQ